MTRYLTEAVRGILSLAIVACCLPQARAEVTGTTLLGFAGTLTGAVNAPGDDDRLYLMGRSGQIQTLDLQTGAMAPYLSIPGISRAGEGGLLGLAFHPDYANNGKLYTYFTTAGGSFNKGVSNIVEYTRTPGDPNSADLGSARPILSFDQPQTNHNGGWIGFSPTDDYLYLAFGDGGGGDDNDTGHTDGSGNSQDITDNLLGKMLRLDIDGDDFPADADRNYAIPATNPFVGTTGDDEIWAYGLRNPFRNSFDRQTGDLWIGDVGQSFREEIDLQADGVAGVNYGWRLREGDVMTPSAGVGGPKPAGAVDPVYDYTHGSGDLKGNSVTGGFVYRGPDPEVQGDYFFADFASSNYWRFDPANPDGTVANINDNLFDGLPAGNPVSFAEDNAGNLYIITISGAILRVDTDALIAGDYNADGVVDDEDHVVWKEAFGDGAGSLADGNKDGIVDAADYTIWRDHVGSTALNPSASKTVPEPTTMVLFGAAAVLLVVVFRFAKGKLALPTGSEEG